MKKPSAPKNPPMSAECARSAGGMTAAGAIAGNSAWGKGPIEELRAKHYTVFAEDILDQEDFLEVMQAWEVGFDSVAGTAKEPAESLRSRDYDYAKWDKAGILAHIQKLLREEHECKCQMAAIAYGGKAYLAEGDNPDAVSEGMFGAIVSLSEDAHLLYTMEDALAELLVREGGAA